MTYDIYIGAGLFFMGLLGGWMLREWFQPTKHYRVRNGKRYFMPGTGDIDPFRANDPRFAFSTEHQVVAEAIASKFGGTVEEYMA